MHRGGSDASDNILSVVYLPCRKHLYECGIGMIDDLAVPDIKLRNLSHIIIGKSKVPDIEVLPNPLLVH